MALVLHKDLHSYNTVILKDKYYHFICYLIIKYTLVLMEETIWIKTMNNVISNMFLLHFNKVCFQEYFWVKCHYTATKLSLGVTLPSIYYLSYPGQNEFFFCYLGPSSYPHPSLFSSHNPPLLCFCLRKKRSPLNINKTLHTKHLTMY